MNKEIQLQKFYTLICRMKLILLMISLFIFSTIKAQDGKFKENYKPKNLHEAITQLINLHHDTTKQQILSMTEQEFILNSHFGIGLWIRNKWGLWRGGKLAKYFNSLGIFHADDMSTIILTSYHRKLRNKDYDLEKLAKSYREKYEEQNIYKYEIPDTVPLREFEK